MRQRVCHASCIGCVNRREVEKLRVHDEHFDCLVKFVGGVGVRVSGDPETLPPPM